MKKKPGAATEAPLKESIAAFEKKLEPLRAGKGAEAPNLGAIGEALTSLATDVEGGDAVPTTSQEKVLADCRDRLSRASDLWTSIQGNDLAQLNRQLSNAHQPALHVPAADEIRIGEPSDGKDLP